MTAERLKTRAEFLAARRGRRLNGPFFFIEALERPEGGPARVGLTVTKKVGNAVERNRIRRRLREAIRTRCRADMAPGFDYVIVARRDLLDVPFALLAGELSRRFGRVRRRPEQTPAEARPSERPLGDAGLGDGGHPLGDVLTGMD